MTDDDLLVDALARNVAGVPAALLGWQELLRVRDHVDRLLDAEVNRRQFSDLPAAGRTPVPQRPAATPGGAT